MLVQVLVEEVRLQMRLEGSDGHGLQVQVEEVRLQMRLEGSDGHGLSNGSWKRIPDYGSRTRKSSSTNFSSGSRLVE